MFQRLQYTYTTKPKNKQSKNTNVKKTVNTNIHESTNLFYTNFEKNRNKRHDEVNYTNIQLRTKSYSKWDMDWTQVVSSDTSPNRYGLSNGKMYISNNNGVNWKLSTLPTSTIWSSIVNIGLFTVILSGYSDKYDTTVLAKSTDYGENWTIENISYIPVSFTSLKVNKSNEQELVGITSYNALYSSNNGGHTWTLRKTPNIYFMNILDISNKVYLQNYKGIYTIYGNESVSTLLQKDNMQHAVINKKGDFIYALSMNINGTFQKHITKDGGETWNSSEPHESMPNNCSILIANESCTQMAILSKYKNEDENKLYISNDYGVTWHLYISNYVTSFININYLDNGHLVATNHNNLYILY